MGDETERAIDEFLDGNPRAGELAEMITALEVRRATFVREREAATSDEARREWQTRLNELEKQIRVLREEQAITGFVEGSIRAAINRSVELDDEAL